MKKIISLLLICLLLAAGSSFPAGTVKGAEMQSVEGTYVPNQIIVVFDDAVMEESNACVSLGEHFGRMMAATSSSDRAYALAGSQGEILEETFGEDFVLEDTLIVDERCVISLVSSKRYDTAEMLDMIGNNPGVTCSQPNRILTPAALTDYSLNDPLNSYLYHLNSSQAKNTTGSSTDAFGTSGTVSLNAGTGWKMTETAGEELVVAVIDSGILATHEDLKDRLWTNPGNIGLTGEHGFNFFENSTDITDTQGHGTHCAGIIAAAVDNGLGVAGVAGSANVKIMMLSTGAASDNSSASSSFVELGAFNYALQAKLKGVNIVATSNSWGNDYPAYNRAFDEILNRLGEAGVMNFIAAGNKGIDLDTETQSPNCSESPYVVVVGAADCAGRPAGFSNYGRTTVDLYAPGLNILSTVSYPTYFPNLDTGEGRSAVTEYYGGFTPETVIANGTVTPEVLGCDESVKSFGALQFRKQSTSSETGSDDASLELKISTDRYFTVSDAPASLEVTIKNARMGELYYVFFPYEKNPDTTGYDNTNFSLYVMEGYQDGNFEASIKGGEVVVDEQGACSMTGNGIEIQPFSKKNVGKDIHFTKFPPYGESMLASAKDVAGKTVGIGVCITPGEDINDEKPHDLRFFIDTVAVSKPGAVFDANRAYDTMTGTSMACPMATGSYALLASIYPRKEGQTPAEYALWLKSKLFSCVRQNDAMQDRCVTGGYLDLSLLTEDRPTITDAVCDVEADTLTLTGLNLSGDFSLSYRRLMAADSQPLTLPEDSHPVTMGEDGSSLVIHNAKDLFGTLAEFTVSDRNGVLSRYAAFLVKGQPGLTTVSTQWLPETLRSDPNHKDAVPRILLTDPEGNDLYCFQAKTGTFFRFDGDQFTEIKAADLTAAVREELRKQGLTDYDIANRVTIEMAQESALVGEGQLYQIVNVTVKPTKDAPAEEHKKTTWLTALDMKDALSGWKLQEITLPEEVKTKEVTWCVMGNKLIAFTCGYESSVEEGDTPQPVLSYDMTAGKWDREADFPYILHQPKLTAWGDKMVVYSGYRYPGLGQPADRMLSRDVYYLENGAWTRMGQIPYVGKHEDNAVDMRPVLEGIAVPAQDGIMFLHCSADGAGNCFMLDGTGTLRPLFLTGNDGLNDYSMIQSAVETRAGIYCLRLISDGFRDGWELSLLPAERGLYTSSFQPAEKETPREEPATVETAVDETSSGLSWPWILAIAGVVLALVTGVVVWFRLRRRNQS